MVHAGSVFVTSIHPSKTWMSGSFESTWQNACVQRLDFDFYSHPKEFWGKRVRTHVNLMGKIPSTRGSEDGQIHDAAYYAGQWAQHTPDWAILAPCLLVLRQMPHHLPPRTKIKSWVEAVPSMLYMWKRYTSINQHHVYWVQLGSAEVHIDRVQCITTRLEPNIWSTSNKQQLSKEKLAAFL